MADLNYCIYGSMTVTGFEEEAFSVKCFILCGGKATRLAGINSGRPKCLMKIDGETPLGRLIEGCPSTISDVIISYSDNLSLYLELLAKRALYFSDKNLTFELDQVQHGTAMAVCNSDFVQGSDLLLLNGDTVYELGGLTNKLSVDENEICFGLSFQSVTRSGRVQIGPNRKSFKYLKNRSGDELKADWVLNGSILVGKEALATLQKCPISEGGSLEDWFLQQSKDENSKVFFTTFNSQCKFIDIGFPDDFFLCNQGLDFAFEKVRRYC